jgi:hypothetical protein
MTERQHLFLYVLGMRKVGEENDREFYKPNPADPTEPANWITLEITEADIGPGEDVILNWSISPSEQAKCGTNMAAIVVSPSVIDDTVATDEAIASMKEEVVSQVHVDVSKLATIDNCPKVGSALDVIDFKVEKYIPLFNYDNVKLLTRLENSGNLIAQSPKGYITIKGFNVDREDGTIDFNEENLDVYPNTVRRFNDLWVDPDYPSDGNILSQFVYEMTHLRIGKYTAELGIIKNVDPDIIVTTSFWVFPWKLAVLLAVIILIIIAYIFYRRKTGIQYVSKRKSGLKSGK